jgi:D-sedoheptulose 7-phosphate isomerase
MTGNKKSPMKELSDFYIDVPNSSTPKIQEGHSIVGHIICGIIEEKIFSEYKK